MLVYSNQYLLINEKELQYLLIYDEEDEISV